MVQLGSQASDPQQKDLTWYLQRVQALEEERELFAELLRVLDSSDTRCDNGVARENVITDLQTEITALKKAVSDAHENLFEEREKVLHIKQSLGLAETSACTTALPAQQDHLVKQRIAALQSERDEAQNETRDLQIKLQETEQEVQRLQRALRRTAEDCLAARIQRESAAEEVATLTTQLEDQQTLARQRLQEARSQVAKSTTAAKSQAVAAAEREAARLKEQLQTQRTKMQTLEQAHEEVKQRLEHRLKSLEEAATVAVKRQEHTYRRRAMDVEGWNADLAAVRRQVATADRRLRQLAVAQSIDNEDVKHAVLSRYEKLAKMGGRGQQGDSDGVGEFDSFTDWAHRDMAAGCQGWMPHKEDGSNVDMDIGSIAHELDIVRAVLVGMQQRALSTVSST